MPVVSPTAPTPVSIFTHSKAVASAVSNVEFKSLVPPFSVNNKFSPKVSAPASNPAPGDIPSKGA